MKRSSGGRRRPAIHITLARAARLHRLVTIIATAPRTRDQLLADLKIGLRTFYRELELLRRCGVRVRLEAKHYRLVGTAEEAEGRLPFPDPQLSFAEMAELSRCPGAAGGRLAGLLEIVVGRRNGGKTRARRARAATRRARGAGLFDRRRSG